MNHLVWSRAFADDSWSSELKWGSSEMIQDHFAIPAGEPSCDRYPRKVVLTVVAVLVLAAINGSIRLHLQVEALLAEQPGHNPFQLRFWRDNRKETQPSTNPSLTSDSTPKCMASRFTFMWKGEFEVLGLTFHDYSLIRAFFCHSLRILGEHLLQWPVFPDGDDWEVWLKCLIWDVGLWGVKGTMRVTWQAWGEVLKT